MRKYQLDLTQSKAVYEQYKYCIKMKECYNNIFNIVTECHSKFRTGKWKVAYGYTEVMAGVFCRHCFILDTNDKVIDPTIYTQSEQYDRAYIVVKVFADIDDYINAIANEDCMPALEMQLREQDKQAQDWAKENKQIFIG